MPAVGADHEIGIDAFGPAVLQHDHAGCPPACIEQHLPDFATVSDLDDGTTRHPGYAVSQRKRKRVEEIFGWRKTIGLLRKLRHRGGPTVTWIFRFTQPRSI